MIYAIDFDGTLCHSIFPQIGEPMQPMIDRVKELKQVGHTLILWTCRVGEELAQAVEWCQEQGLQFDYINENASDTLAQYGTDPRKISADHYIDDKSILIADFVQQRGEVRAMKVEIRADNTVHIEGYVNAVGRDSRILPSPRGKFVEQVEPKTFERAMSSNPNIQLKLNHKRVLGSTNDNSLTLYEDSIGLYAKAVTSDVGVVESARKGELRGWSFGFEKRADSWEDTPSGVPRRLLKEINLTEVSIVDKNLTPCYVGTSIEVRGEEDFISETRSFEQEVEVINNTHPKPHEFSLYEREIEIIRLKTNG